MTRSIEEIQESIVKNLSKRGTNKNQKIVSDLSSNSVTKSNALARAFYKFTLTEKRVMECLISKIHPARSDNLGFKDKSKLVLTAQEYSKLYDINENKAYKRLKEAVDGLCEKVITIKLNEKRYIRYPLLSEADYEVGEGRISVKFNSVWDPHLQDQTVKSKFTKYPKKEAINFSSMYTYRFYELLQSWSKKDKLEGWINTSIDNLRNQLGIPESYTYSRFALQIFKLSKEELEDKLNMTINITTFKEGRKITKAKISFVKIIEKEGSQNDDK